MKKKQYSVIDICVGFTFLNSYNSTVRIYSTSVDHCVCKAKHWKNSFEHPKQLVVELLNKGTYSSYIAPREENYSTELYQIY